jgi:hypothetical protein
MVVVLEIVPLALGDDERSRKEKGVEGDESGG